MFRTVGDLLKGSAKAGFFGLGFNNFIGDFKPLSSSSTSTELDEQFKQIQHVWRVCGVSVPGKD